MLSIDTVPTSGTRRPPTSTSQSLRERAAHAVAVADRHRADPGRRGGDEAPAVADALPDRERLDLGHVGAQLQRGRQPVARRVLPERVHAVGGDAAAHQVQARLRERERRGRVGGVQQQVAVRGAERLAPRARSGRAARARSPGSSSAVAKCVIAPASRNRGAAAIAAAVRVASPASRVPSRPMPVSSLTCTPARSPSGCPASAAANPSRQATTSARARSAAVSSAADSAPMTSSGPADPGRAQVDRLLRRRNRQPARAAGLRRARGGHRAVAVAVGLDDRRTAAPAPRRARARAQLRSIAARSTRASARTATPGSAPRARRHG